MIVIGSDVSPSGAEIWRAGIGIYYPRCPECGTFLRVEMNTIQCPEPRTVCSWSPREGHMYIEEWFADSHVIERSIDSTRLRDLDAELKFEDWIRAWTGITLENLDTAIVWNGE